VQEAPQTAGLRQMSQHDVTELIIERSPEDLEADRQVAAFLAYAAKRDPAFAQYDRRQGLSLRHATLAYGDLESAKLYEALHAWGFGPLDQYGDLTLFRAAKRLSSEELCSKLSAGELRAADVMKPRFVDRRDRVSEMLLRSKCIDKERELREALVDKLLRGEVHATGFATNQALDRPATAIPPDRWRILVPDFDESSALCFSGIKIEGILVFPGPAPRASYAEVKSAIEKLGDAPEKQLLERVREALHDKKISRDQVRQARSEAFGTRIGRPPKLLK
jgi:hypothetical protein